MARVKSSAIRTASGPFTTPKSLSSTGGLVRTGSYMTRSINLQSRPRFVEPLKPSAVAGKMQKLPKGMD